MQAKPVENAIPRHYRGRFAPSPSGPLHFGSLVAALGSYLDAKAAGGTWILRIEDIDPPRVMPGAVDAILWQLDGLGLHWDEEVIFQSQRLPAYRDALERLRAQGLLYRCDCSRKEILDTARQGLEGPVYPGKCKALEVDATYAAWRMRTPRESIECRDRKMGDVSFSLSEQLGDFVVQRADGVFAYQLAVVVDDALQCITDVVRGSDLWFSTPRQLYLQSSLALPTPRYLHLPLVKNAAGEKLSKQTLAQAVEPQEAARLLWLALDFLGQRPPAELVEAERDAILRWAIVHWDISAIPDALV